MTQAFITVAIPFASDRVQGVNEFLSAFGNPARPAIAAALDQSAFVHFMSMTIAHQEGEASAHLILEASADGSAYEACARLARTIGSQIADVLRAAGLKVLGTSAHISKNVDSTLGPAGFRPPAWWFSGTPGMSVRRIKEEARLASWIGDWLERNRNPESPLQKLERVRAEIFEMPELKWAFVAEPVPLLGEKPKPSAVVRPLIVSLLRDLLWPLAVPPMLAPLLRDWFSGARSAQAIGGAVLAFGAEILLVVAGLWIGYLWLRRHEKTDAHTDLEPNAALVAEIMAARTG